LDMFVYQGAESYKIWTQQQPNYDVMRSTVLNYL
ncbi:shikimate dehydrogenase, partial [Staphylococcus arlettae]